MRKKYAHDKSTRLDDIYLEIIMTGSRVSYKEVDKLLDDLRNLEPTLQNDIGWDKTEIDMKIDEFLYSLVY